MVPTCSSRPSGPVAIKRSPSCEVAIPFAPSLAVPSAPRGSDFVDEKCAGLSSRLLGLALHAPLDHTHAAVPRGAAAVPSLVARVHDPRVSAGRYFQSRYVAEKIALTRAPSPTAAIFPNLYGSGRPGNPRPPGSLTHERGGKDRDSKLRLLADVCSCELPDARTRRHGKEKRHGGGYHPESAPTPIVPHPFPVRGYSQRDNNGQRRGQPGTGSIRCEYVSPWTGDRCNVHFKNKYDAARHVRGIHRRQERDAVAAGNLALSEAHLLRALAEPDLTESRLYWNELHIPVSIMGKEGRDEDLVCEKCWISFSRKDSLTRHLRRH